MEDCRVLLPPMLLRPPILMLFREKLLVRLLSTPIVLLLCIRGGACETGILGLIGPIKRFVWMDFGSIFCYLTLVSIPSTDVML